MKVDEFNFAVKIFDQGRATFNPIPAVQILHAVDHFCFRAVNVTADDPVGLLVAGHGCERVFVFRDKFDGRLGLELEIRRQ